MKKYIFTVFIVLIVCCRIHASELTYKNYRENKPGFRLDSDVENKILELGNIKEIQWVNSIELLSKITDVSDNGKPVSGYLFLVISAEFVLIEGWEGVWHGVKILVRKIEAPDWSHSQFIDVQYVDNIFKLQWMDESAIQELIARSKNLRDNAADFLENSSQQ